MVWSMVQEMTPEFSDARAKRGAVTVAVRECVATMDGNFTWNEIKDAIEASDPNASPNRTTISQILKKMANSGKLEVIEIGIGKRPTRYVAIRTSLPVP